MKKVRSFLLYALAVVATLLATAVIVHAGILKLADQIVLDDTNTIVTFADTGAAGLQNGPSTMTITYDFVSEDYFRCNPNGHWGLMERATLENIPTAQYRGSGILIGNVWSNGGSTAGVPNFRPFAMIESWGIGVVPDSFGFLMFQSASPQLADWVQYKMFVETKHTIVNYVHYSIYRLDFVRSQYVLIYDTGDVLDNNWGIDMTRQAAAFFNASTSSICPSRVRITNVWGMWSIATTASPDLTALTPKPYP